MKYRLPTLEDKNLLSEYISEHYCNYQKILNASANLTEMDYDKWVERVNKCSEEAQDEWGRFYLYLAFDSNDKLIGLLNIRYDMDFDKREYYGDIGYAIRPTERRKGYAKELLKHGLEVCKDNGLDYVIIGCYRDNVGSKKVIEGNGGVYYKTEPEEHVLGNDWKINMFFDYYKIAI